MVLRALGFEPRKEDVRKSSCTTPPGALSYPKTRLLGCPQVKRMIASVDKTGSGKIDFNEFLALLLAKMVPQRRTAPGPLLLLPSSAWQRTPDGPRPHSAQSERDTKEDTMRAFKQFDLQHQGAITFENLKQVSRELGAPAPGDRPRLRTRRAARGHAAAWYRALSCAAPG